MLPREHARYELAKKICALPYSRLLEWGISRPAAVDGLDVIGLPVYTCCRPPGEVITISAGKGLTKIDSMAGAILEGVEIWSAEHPERYSEWMYGSYKTVVESFKNVISFDHFQLARDAPVTENTMLCFEEMHDVFRDRPVVVPSDMIWLAARVKPPFQYFQSGTSGLAAGINVQDATVQAVYEVIERDGWAISEFIQDRTGQWPCRISLDCELHPSLKICMDHLNQAKVTPFLFDLTRDIHVPLFRCTILDAGEYSPGCFSGFGCSLDPITSARRAITEACQARVAYISGARDDLFRRRFILLKNINMSILMDMHKALPKTRDFTYYKEVIFNSIDHEWYVLKSVISDSGLKEVYRKTIYSCDDPEFHIVKVIMPECECPAWEYHSPGKRSWEALTA